MKRLLLFVWIPIILIVFLFPTYAASQCSVTKDNTDAELVTYLTKNERLYQNEDLENGLKTAFAQSFLVVNKADKNKVKFSVIVTYVKTSYQPEIVPRQITFSFSNGENITSTADEYDSPNLNGTKGERCYFRITVPNMEKIKSNSISSFTITDSRTGQNLVTKPYAGIFQEQIQCLLKKQNEL